MVASSAPYPPRLPPELREVDAGDLTDDIAWEGIAVRGDLTGRVIKGLDFGPGRLRGLSLVGTHLERARVTNTVVERCDLNAAVLEGVVLSRVVFSDCRMSGADFSAAQLNDVVFQECRLTDANLRLCQGNRVRFEHCDLARADLYRAQFLATCVFDCNLSSSDLSQASLTGARLHGSTFEGLKGAAALRGTTVSSAQLVPVALHILSLLEIDVDDEREPTAAGRPAERRGPIVPR